MIAFVVPKRLHKKAHVRNLLRRRIKEAVRLEKHRLAIPLKERNRSLSIVIRYETTALSSFSEIQTIVRTFIDKIILSLPPLEIPHHPPD